ncbi:MAG: radical SAM protein [Desulfobacterales bacterium]
MSKVPQEYRGFEQGPIRPPSEACSLLIRVTRNCPWNFCTFCPVYKGKKFSLRPAVHVKKDIDTVHRYLEIIREKAGSSGRITQGDVRDLAPYVSADEENAFYAALNWFASGMRSIFLQDANSLIIKPADLRDILLHLQKRFPETERITSYARSHTIARIRDEDLKAFREAGLNRIHIGLESGSDEVLKLVRKGTTKAMHIKAGLKVKQSGMELSEYVMPGLGGRNLSEVHARETADALNQINPDFIRLRTLAIPNRIPLFAEYQEGTFEKCNDLMMAKEILLFIEQLNGITSTLKSDHILNLFQEVEGVFPDDKKKMIGILKKFLDLPPQDQCCYQVGRRLGIFHELADMNSSQRMRKVEKFCRENKITPDNADRVIDELMKRFI